jgi:thiamine pyrophosphokinase
MIIQEEGFMKKILIIFLLSLILPTFTYSAEYLGKDIDGIEYDCTAYSYDTGSYYYVTVEFYDDEATITFDHGGYITVTLDDEEIEDPDSIDAYSYDKGVYWELEVDNLD